jgi:hypothetical protein
MHTQKQKNEEAILTNKTRINEISKTIFFVTTSIQFLGMDRNRSEYFLLYREPHRVYIKHCKGLLDTGRHYRLYEGKAKVTELMHCLNSKGIK